ncbi:RNase P Rpp14 domain containing protein [Asbolus verrucosus]|uniref:Ribonuclease P/MRP protein subunit POP5 n=1 Tax=Asbolus verrucosus TaxID=1661398 RepID=A0A482WED3_ASBVE|nr:RNase P Rpp14 domain containing protein [Asbolus verrucosus]
MVRHKNRYMIIEINQGAKKDSYALQLKPPSLHYSIMSMVQQLHGDFGVAAIMAGFTAKYCNEKTRIAIIRCRHGPHRLVASSLPCIKFIENKPVNINTLYIGATIKHCFKFIKNYQQRKFEEYCVGLKNDEEKEALKKALMNLDPILSIH